MTAPHPLDLGAGDNVPPFLRRAANVQQPVGVDATLAERDGRYGSFDHQATLTQQLKQCMHCAPKWLALPDDMKESLEMIASKIARILNGDPQYPDSWHDIAGYALLIEKRLTP